MNRKALIIASPGTEGTEGYCEGVNKDVKNYKSFLLSPIGGLWREDEIKILFKPSEALTISEISSLKKADYSITVFCGHGYHSQRTDSTIVELKPNVRLDSAELRIGAPKHTLILDCCREKANDIIIEFTMENAKFDSVHKTSIINPMNCRRCYDDKISSCAPGLVVLHGCSIDETAGDDEAKGGVYSYSLIEAAKDWERNIYIDTTKNYKTLSIVEAHNSAVPNVLKLSGNRQKPTIEKPRSENFFPFCIIA